MIQSMTPTVAAPRPKAPRWLATLAGTALLSTVGAGAALAEYSESFRFSGRSLYVGNLIGEIEVEGSSGQDFEVEVSVEGSDAARGVVDFEQNQNSLMIVFPVDRGRFVYPELGRSTTSISLKRYDGDSSLLKEIMRAVTGRTIKVSGRGSGTELWADVVIRVPQGASLEVEHGVGKIVANNVNGEIDLEVSSGGIEANSIDGDVELDTGSGGISLSDIRGNVVADTGSGAVKVAGVTGDSLTVDTGSGDVVLSSISTRRLEVDTGSGAVEGADVRAGSALIDTGSGSVFLEMVGMDSGDYEIDTGSGSITLLVPSNASADVQADTGSGGISVDLPGIETIHRERDEMRFKVGDGDARVRLDTGSGRIRVSAVD